MYPAGCRQTPPGPDECVVRIAVETLRRPASESTGKTFWPCAYVRRMTPHIDLGTISPHYS